VFGAERSRDRHVELHRRARYADLHPGIFFSIGVTIRFRDIRIAVRVILSVPSFALLLSGLRTRAQADLYADYTNHQHATSAL